MRAQTPKAVSNPNGANWSTSAIRILTISPYANAGAELLGGALDNATFRGTLAGVLTSTLAGCTTMR